MSDLTPTPDEIVPVPTPRVPAGVLFCGRRRCGLSVEVYRGTPITTTPAEGLVDLTDDEVLAVARVLDLTPNTFPFVSVSELDAFERARDAFAERADVIVHENRQVRREGGES